MWMSKAHFGLMSRLGFFFLVLSAAGGLSDPVKNIGTPKLASHEFLEKQLELMSLFDHIHEPHHIESCINIAANWSLADNADRFDNRTAVKTYVTLMNHDRVLPRGFPFSLENVGHQFETTTLFNILYYAKDYQTFYKTAVYLRDRINENIFVYVLTAAIIHRHDTQGIILPPIYEVLPEYFYNGEILDTAQRINVHGDRMIEHLSSTYKSDQSIVIRWNATIWPYSSKSTPIWYLLQDHGLNAFYYYHHLTNPQWLRGNASPFVRDRRGELFWFLHKQLLTRYYMERLSNGLGEIDELGLDVVHEGHKSGLLYYNGIPFPIRPNHLHLKQPKFVRDLEKIKKYEHRIRKAIDSGYIVNSAGEHVSIRNPEAIDILGRVIEANVDSPNLRYYKDFISIWKSVLGNSNSDEQTYYHYHLPLVVPSTMQQYWTTLRDPAFYMIWKRVLNLFALWHQQLPLYTTEELGLPSVAIEKLEVDKLETFFEYTYTNITSFLHRNKQESQRVYDDVSVLVQQPRINYKKFAIRVHVKSEDAKTVAVKLFLAPKYDSHGNEIPLHRNTENFFMLDYFIHELPQGESVIVRKSTQNPYTSHDWTSAHDVHQRALSAREGEGVFAFDPSQTIINCPERFLLPKGRASGMPFVLMAFITEYRPAKVPHRLTDDPLGFPVDRPLFINQINDLHNIVLQDVLIYHDYTTAVLFPTLNE